MTTYSIKLGITNYKEIYDLQSSIALKKQSGDLTDDFVFFLEHKSVFTLGKRGGKENLTVSEEFLKERGVDLVHVERGGNITYHGEGQIVVYPLIDIKSFGFSVRSYVDSLEEIMIKTSADYGVAVSGDEKNRGAWVGKQKIGSVGIAVKKNIVFHGLAININPDLTPFTWVNPCGLEGVSITSIAKELGVEIDLNDAYNKIIKNTQKIFKTDFTSISREELLEVIE